MYSFDLIYPSRSTIQYKSMIFPDGQPHVKIDMETVCRLNKTAPLKILTRINNSADLILLLFVKNTLDYLEFEHVELHISYLLSARMDRVMVEGEPFSLKVIAQIINQANFKKVKIFDPHSEVSMALIDRSYAISNHFFVKDAMDDYFKRNSRQSFCIVSPDAGALKKIYKLATDLSIENIVECMKLRDLKTGALSGFKTTAENLSGLTCFIIDDICDGGGTFSGTAKMLKEKGAGKVILLVSHGIFSKGNSIEAVDTIYSTDSYRSIPDVNCFEVSKYIG